MVERAITVLVAEDDFAQREILSEVLTCEGYNVLTSSTPAQTLERLEAAPDLVLLDVNGTTSPEVEAMLKRPGKRPQVVIVSGDCTASDTARNVGAKHHVEKPYELHRLLDLVAKLAERKLRFSLVPGGLQPVT